MKKNIFSIRQKWSMLSLVFILVLVLLINFVRLKLIAHLAKLNQDIAEREMVLKAKAAKIINLDALKAKGEDDLALAVVEKIKQTSNRLGLVVQSIKPVSVQTKSGGSELSFDLVVDGKLAALLEFIQEAESWQLGLNVASVQLAAYSPKEQQLRLKAVFELRAN